MEPLIVSRAEAGQKLFNFLERRVDAPAGDIHKWIRTGQVRCNGGRVKAFERVEEGESIRIPPFAALRQIDGGVPARNHGGGLPRIFEDEELLVIDKPAGLPTQGGSGHSDSVAARIARAYAGAEFIPAPVHRLDKDTTGLLLLGKTYASVRRLADAAAGRADACLGKEYLAWVWGKWSEETARELHDRLEKDVSMGRVMALRQTGNNAGKEARSLVASIRGLEWEGESVSLLLLRLFTGRTHQIRVQFASRGFPVLGDGKYGNRTQDRRHGIEGLKLHACRLALPEPDGRVFVSLPSWDGRWEVLNVPVAMW